MRFSATIQLNGKSATGIQVPDEIVTQLGSGKRPPVWVTINGHRYRSTVAPLGGVFMIPLSAENRTLAHVSAGDEVEVEIEFDSEPREVQVPPDFLEALARDADAQRFFEGLSYSNKQRIVLSIEGAKTAETRQRRITQAVSALREGRA
ncbi:MAG TPA: YdeI/OmpD-associated family protein [Ktedonobacterales bacterium]|nr:YdeI/OmpD-associated family protein [Ktedonobacterales bacterium]